MIRLTLFFVILPILLFAQKNSKLNIDLFLEMQQVEKQNYELVFVPALVKGNLAVIEQVVREGKGQYKYGVKNIASVYVSLSTIEGLLANPAVQRVEYRKAIAHHLFDEDSVMMSNNNAWDVHGGGGNLPHGFQGEGVMLGVIDDGFDWQHPDFRNADSTTRIMHLWDQYSSDPLFAEQFYGYGASWDSSDINAYQCSHVAGEHGSHVMGTAGGNALASGKYIGIAPKADLACVRVASDASFLYSFVDGIHFIFDKADAAGQACAINSSVGSYSSGHDGKDLHAQLIDNMLTAKTGRALIQAGGNARQYDFHLGVNLVASTATSWFKWHNNAQRTHFLLYADTANFNNVNFSLELRNPVTYQVIAQTTSFNVLQDFTFTGSVATFSQVLFNDANGAPVTLEIYIDQYEDSYEIYYSISSMSNLGNWQLTTTGTGKYDIWSKEALTGTSDIFPSIAIPNYVSPNNIQSIVGYWTCSDKVITVSSYQNRSYMVTWTNDTIFIGTGGYPKYGISHFSSLGPTRTGLQKPDITAPGGQVMSAASLATIAYYKQIGDSRLDQDGWHVSNRGTSMAAPMVTGAAALLLQCNPNASCTDIMQALKNSAKLDSFVFKEVMALPNIHWGSGKLDVYKLIENCLVYGCNDTLALNYNPSVTVFDSSCIFNVTSINQLQTTARLTCQPNPFYSTTTIDYQLANNSFQTAKIAIYNLIGQQVFVQQLTQAQGQVQFSKKDLAVGSYWVVLESNGKKIAHQQLILGE